MDHLIHYRTIILHNRDHKSIKHRKERPFGYEAIALLTAEGPAGKTFEF